MGAVQLGASEDPVPVEIVADDPTTTASVETTDAESTTTVPVPFVYRVGVLAGAGTDNFWAYYGNEPSVWNSYILGPTKPALYTVDDATGEMTPELLADAATPTRDAEGWRMAVQIAPGFEWSDGEPITARDLAFTFETVRAQKLRGSWAQSFPAVVTSVYAEDDYELVIEFAERPNLSVWPYGVGLAPVMAEHVWADVVAGISAKELYAMGGESDVSGGPLVLASVSGELVVSEANPGYPADGYPDSVEYHVYPDEGELVAAVGRGEIDSILTPNGVTVEQVASVADQPGVATLVSPANGVRYLGFNLEREPMAKPAFRRALARLLDREKLAGQIAHTGNPAWAMIPAANDQWFDAEAAGVNRGRYTAAPAKRLRQAIDELTGAGYAWETPPKLGENGELVPGEGLTIDGRPPQPLTILTPGDAYDPARPEYVTAIAETLGVLGFDARPVETDFDTVVDLAFTPGEEGARGYDMYLLGWTLGNPTLPAFYRPFFASNGAMNNTGYASKKFNGALAAYEGAVTVEEARTALWQMENTLSVDLPYLVLYTNHLTEIYRADRVSYELGATLGGLQARLGGIADVRPVD